MRSVFLIFSSAVLICMLKVVEFQRDLQKSLVLISTIPLSWAIMPITVSALFCDKYIHTAPVIVVAAPYNPPNLNRLHLTSIICNSVAGL